jgi:hypothetical protein
MGFASWFFSAYYGFAGAMRSMGVSVMSPVFRTCIEWGLL